MIGWLGGAMGQLVNEVTRRVPLPISMLEPAPLGDVLEPIGSRARAGARAMERLLDELLGRTAPVDPIAARSRRPLVSAAEVVAPAGGTTRLTLRVSLDGFDWARHGATGAPLAVYVDGRYAGFVVATSERGDGRYTLNVGHLPPGPHRVEVRAMAPIPSGARVGVSRIEAPAVDAATLFVDRHAPIVELRTKTTPGGRRRSLVDSDLPMFVAPVVRALPDGGTLIEYRVAFSNEDGGTRTDLLLRNYGRTVDVEPVFRVELDARGDVRSRQYMSTPHVWRTFDGVLDHGRPVLRISTTNSMVSSMVTPGAGTDRWAEAPGRVVEAEIPDVALIMQRPWAWALMGKELLREGKAALDPRLGAAQVVPAPGTRRRRPHQLAGDPRSYIYLGPIDDAARAAVLATGTIRLRLRGGRHLDVRVDRELAERWLSNGTAIRLPPTPLVHAIVGVVGLRADAVLLDARFAPRLLAKF